MADLHSEVLSIIQELEATPDGRPQALHELLFFPEILTYGHKDSRLRQEGKRLAQSVIRGQALDGLHRRQIVATFDVKTLALSVDAPRGHAAWTQPVEMALPYLQWHHAKEAIVAYVPALRIEVIVSEEASLEKELTENVLSALRRRRLNESLLPLAFVQRARALKVEQLVWNANPPTAAERFRDLYEPNARQADVLRHVAMRLRAKEMPKAYHRESDVERLVQLLTGRRKSSVLLIGPPGSGKTALVKEMVRTESAGVFKDLTLWQSSGSRLIAGQTGFGMWQQRCRDLIEEIRKNPALLYLGNLFELMQVGQSSASSESIASFLRPSMMRGELLVVVECSPEQLSAIETHDPKLLDAFRQLSLSEPDQLTSNKILTKISKEPTLTRAVIEPEALHRIDALHRRYATYSAFPGRPARFLRRLRLDAAEGATITSADVIHAFTTETGLPRVILDDAIGFDHDEVSAWFAARVMAQSTATSLVTNTLATIKMRLSRPQKPLASFMFIGPTGVGKTELAKSLAAYLYNSPDRMIRFDMSEYGSPAAAQRLISNHFTGGEGLLTAAVRDEPFSVILLDEFEKADPDVFDLFLQVLGEGRLTDGAGRLADFTNTVVIMTSNLGAATFGRHQLGFDGDPNADQQAIDHFTAAVKNVVRPEFFNRIDQIVPFFPLSRAAVRQIADRELDLVRRRTGLASHHLELDVEREYLDRVIDEGYDPRYGARPLKRAIERRILIPVANVLNATSHQDGRVHVGERVEFSASKANCETDSPQSAAWLHRQIGEAGRFRHALKRLHKSSLVGELRSEQFRIEQAKTWEKRRARRKAGAKKEEEESWFLPFDPKAESRLAHIEGVLGRLDSSLRMVVDFEETALIHLYESNHLAGETVPTEPLAFSDDDRQDLLIDCYATYENTKDTATLLFVADDRDWLHQLVKLYATLFDSDVARLTGAVYYRHPSKEYQGTDEDGNAVIKPHLHSGKELSELLAKIPKECGALGLEIQAPLAWLTLRHESGQHMHQSAEDKRSSALVSVLTEPLSTHVLEPNFFERIVSAKTVAVRREFHYVKGYRDTHLEEKGKQGLSVDLIEHLSRQALLNDAVEAINSM